jgi:hypothetical protein
LKSYLLRTAKGEVPRLSQRHKTILPRRTRKARRSKRTKRLIPLSILVTLKFIRSPVFTPASRKEMPPVLVLPYATLSFAFFVRDTSFSSRPFVALSQAVKVSRHQVSRHKVSRYQDRQGILVFTLRVSVSPSLPSPRLSVRIRRHTGLCGSARDSSRGCFYRRPQPRSVGDIDCFKVGVCEPVA